jgi:uncharacterized membrane protein YeaQ/YmgE (transglycosylase-associated protein family)
MTISGAALIVLLVIAAICGAIGRALGGGTRGGLLTSIALGFIGALFGSWLGRQFHLPDPLVLHLGGHPFPVVWAIVGSAVIVLLLHALTRRRSWI